MLEWSLVLILLIPFASGVASLFTPRSLRVGLTTAAVIALLILASYLGTNLTQVLTYQISGWAAPLGINLRIDGLSVVMVVLTSIVCSAVSLYCFGYFQGTRSEKVARGFWPLFFMLWGALNTIFLVSDLFTMYVCLELITFVSVALITLAGDREALNSSLSYFTTALMGSIAYLLGVALLYANAGTLDWSLLSSTLTTDAVGWLALGLMTAGLAIKSALFPLHFWLPRAHAIAPAPVSALLSALVVKASLFVLLRLWIQVFPETPFAAHVIGALGAGAILWGSFQAIIQDRVKLMVAYSTVAQIGYLFLAFPLISVAVLSHDEAAGQEVWNGTIYFLASHAVAKAAMFLVAGIVLQATKTDYLKDMQGAAARVPAAILVWGLAGISLIGLPPSGGFIAKWQLLTSAIRLGQWVYAAVILFGGLLASGYVFRVLWHAFLAPENEASAKVSTDVSYTMLLAALFLGIIIVVMGIATADFFSLLKVGSPAVLEGSP